MNDCYFVITCKDERVFKFRFHQAPIQFGNSLCVIRKYALQTDLKQLYCFRYASEVQSDKFKLKAKYSTTDWQSIAQSTAADFERLNITKLFRPCTIMTQKQPGPVYVLHDVTDA